jgi:hypothetical protein
VDSRIERGRTARHGLIQLIESEKFDRMVVPAQTKRSDGFSPEDIAWLLEHAPTEVVVMRPRTGRVLPLTGARSRRRPRRRIAAAG